MAHLLYIGHMPKDSTLAAELASALGDSYRLTTNSDPPTLTLPSFSSHMPKLSTKPAGKKPDAHSTCSLDSGGICSVYFSNKRYISKWAQNVVTGIRCWVSVHIDPPGFDNFSVLTQHLANDSSFRSCNYKIQKQMIRTAINVVPRHHQLPRCVESNSNDHSTVIVAIYRCLHNIH